VRDNGKSIEWRTAAVERLREFLRLNYMSGAQAAQRIGVRAETLYSWLERESRPASPERIEAFLDSMPAERSGIMPTGFQYREYKNWRGIPKPAALPVLQESKGEIRKARGGQALEKSFRSRSMGTTWLRSCAADGKRSALAVAGSLANASVSRSMPGPKGRRRVLRVLPTGVIH
jgi:transcriptional regulator with XRE-family HTH domain